MRLSNTQAVSRPTYYDRNPTVQWLTYNVSSVAPHATTVRASYTVPAGKKAYAEGAFTSHDRTTAATAAGTVIDAVVYTPSGGAAAHFVRATSIDNTIGAQHAIVGGAIGFLNAGDNVVIQTSDISTAGAVNHSDEVKAVEFDA